MNKRNVEHVDYKLSMKIHSHFFTWNWIVDIQKPPWFIKKVIENVYRIFSTNKVVSYIFLQINSQSPLASISKSITLVLSASLYNHQFIFKALESKKTKLVKV